MIYNECFKYNDRVIKTESKKKQIVLLNTNARLCDYLTGIELRYFKKYDKIPAFTIGKDGEIFKHYEPTMISNVIQRLNSSHIIFIALENLGWLSYDGKRNSYYDWKNNIFESPVLKKTWRNKEYWDFYSDIQINELIKLLNYLCIEFSITNRFIGHNTYVVDASEYEGILVRSNYSKEYYDLSPAFDFNKIIENKK